MPHLHRFLSLCVVLLLGTTLNAQQVVRDVEVSQTYAVKLGTTLPLSEIINARPTDPDKKESLEENRKTIDNFFDREIRPEKEKNRTGKADPLWQNNLEKDMDLIVLPTINIDGLSSTNSNATVPDPCGDIGKDFFVQTLNATLIQVYDKDGNEVGNPINANTIWSQVGFTSAGDPIILYDQENERWIMTEFPPGNQLLVAISQDSNPLGAWTAYAFATPNFPDYPKYSMWDNAIVVTTNESGPGTQPVYMINRAELLAEAPTVSIQRIAVPGFPGGPGFQVATPVDWTGPIAPPMGAKPMIVRLNDQDWGVAPKDEIEVLEFDVDFANPNNTSFTIVDVDCMPFDLQPCASPGAGFACIPQPSGNGIDGLPEVIMHQTHYRNFGSHESMVLNFITDADGNNLSGIRWVELRRTSTTDWQVHQEGTFAPNPGAEEHRFMGGICMDGAGNIGLAYSVSGPNTFPGIRFTGRRASDPLGTLTVQEFVAVDGLSSSPSSRYGDYASMAVDPVDDRTFWFTGEYRRANGWGTRIVAFSLGRDTVDIGALTLDTPADAPLLTATETVTASFENFGLDTIETFEVGYIFENGTAVTDNITFTLAPDSVYTHTFAQTVDMSTIGEYEFKIFGNTNDDTNILNDTLRFTRSHQPRFDAGITGVSGIDGVLCGDQIQIGLSITNFGATPLSSAVITYQLNSDPAQQINWTGNLLMGESETVDVTLMNLLDANTLTVGTSLPNGEADENPSNDQITRTFDAILNDETLTLELLTDNFPNETTWELQAQNGTVLYSGGPYSGQQTLFTESLCVEAGGCYTFVIFDSYGDGIQFQGVEGDYSITDSQGNTLASLIQANFGSLETNSFCLEAICNITANVTVTNVTNPGDTNGVILVSPTSGVGPFLFSIDGGTTFQGFGGFVNLPEGTYDVLVRDGNGCAYAETITVGNTVAIFDPSTGQSFDILPNPTDGRFQIILNGLEFNEVFLPIELYDASGKLVHRSSITRYDQSYIGEVSLLNYPSGVYFVRFNHPEVRRMVRVVKR